MNAHQNYKTNEKEKRKNYKFRRNSSLGLTPKEMEGFLVGAVLTHYKIGNNEAMLTDECINVILPLVQEILCLVAR